MKFTALASKSELSPRVCLAAGENPFSTNKVTGHSLNFPIIGTCRPTTVCSETCYFARGPSTWPSSLAKQHRLLQSLRDDPAALAESIAVWTRRLRLEFIRWCGGGDLVEETPACINRVAVLLPEVPQWIVTRKPTIAARIAPRPNVFVHLSVDRSSFGRLLEFSTLAPAGLNWFWSYQCAPGEVPRFERHVEPAVIFRDGYDFAGSGRVAGDCPLNGAENIAGMCATCRRCFDGTAAKVSAERLGAATAFISMHATGTAFHA